MMEKTFKTSPERLVRRDEDNMKNKMLSGKPVCLEAFFCAKIINLSWDG